MEDKEFYRWLEVLIYSLQLPQWPLEEKISQEEAIVLIANFFNLDPKDPDLPQKAFLKLSEFEAKKETAPHIPPNLKDLVAAYEKYLAAQEVQIKTNPSYWEYYRAIFEEVLKKIQNPYLAKVVSQQATQKASETLPPVAHPQAFEETVSPEEYQNTLQTAIQESFPPEIQLPPETIKYLAETTRPLAAKLAAIPRRIPTPPPPPSISEEIPPSVTAKFVAESQGVAFKPIFTLLHPPTAISFAKKVILSPIVKPLQWAVKIAPENITEEIKKVFLEGLTSKDIQESIKTLQGAGLPSNHPKIDQLKNQQETLKEFETSHKILSFIFRHYHEFSKKTGSRQIQETQTSLWLPKLSPPPAWYQQKGYTWRLREGLNRLGIFFRTHQWIPGPSGRKIIQFVLPDKIIRLVTFGKIQNFAALKTAAYQKIVQPILVWMAKIPLSNGAKKIGSWVLIKLGVSQTAISTAKKGLKAVFSKFITWIGEKVGLNLAPVIRQILTVLSLVWDALKLGFKAIRGIFRKVGKFFTEFLPIKSKEAIQKTSDFTSNIVNKAALVVGAMLASLSTISLPSILPVIAVGGTVGTVAVATALTVITAGSTFIKEGVGVGEQPAHIGTPINPRPPSEAGHLAETVIWTLNECGITSVNKTTWSATKDCLLASNLPNKEVIIDRFHYSVFSVGPGLQCVGFVRGITAALGKELEGGRQAARDYLNPPTPQGYYPLEKDMSKVQIGDLVIMYGTTYGHIGIVVNKKDSYIWVAQAWGTENGLLQITQINPVYFDGFLRPK